MNYIFIGTDSLGYKHGQYYKLILKNETLEGKSYITIMREDGSGRCPYESEEAFKRNWKLDD